MTKTVFFSWQNDTSNVENRYLIRDSLKKAMKRIGEGLEYDEATRGLPGAPDIFAAVRKKIEGCSIFVPDLTYITSIERENDRPKQIPNPNVLVEFGYCLAVKSEQVILPTLNIAYGEVADLPFDISKQRISALYDLPSGSSKDDRKRALEGLSQKFEVGLRQVLQSGVLFGGLSEAALSIARIFVEESEDGLKLRPAYSIEEMAEKCDLPESEVREAVDDLEARDLVMKDPALRTAPKRLLFVECDAFFQPWNPKEDARTLAQKLVADGGHLCSKDVAEELGWSVRRIHPALYYLVHYEIVDPDNTRFPPFVPFGISETRETRLFLRGQYDPANF